MTEQRIPLPTVGFPKQVKQTMKDEGLASQTISFAYSGEFVSGEVNRPLGIAVEEGVLSDFIIAADGQGRDDNDDLMIEADLKLDGVSVLDSAISIEGVSGESPSAFVSEAPSFSATSVSRGDRLSVDLVLTRTTPDVEINNVYVAVKIVPVSS